LEVKTINYLMNLKAAATADRVARGGRAPHLIKCYLSTPVSRLLRADGLAGIPVLLPGCHGNNSQAYLKCQNLKVNDPARAPKRKLKPLTELTSSKTNTEHL